MTDINQYIPRTGREIGEDGSLINVADILQDLAPSTGWTVITGDTPATTDVLSYGPNLAATATQSSTGWSDLDNVLDGSDDTLSTFNYTDEVNPDDVTLTEFDFSDLVVPQPEAASITNIAVQLAVAASEGATGQLPTITVALAGVDATGSIQIPLTAAALTTYEASGASEDWGATLATDTLAASGFGVTFSFDCTGSAVDAVGSISLAWANIQIDYTDGVTYTKSVEINPAAKAISISNTSTGDNLQISGDSGESYDTLTPGQSYTEDSAPLKLSRLDLRSSGAAEVTYKIVVTR